MGEESGEHQEIDGTGRQRRRETKGGQIGCRHRGGERSECKKRERWARAEMRGEGARR